MGGEIVGELLGPGTSVPSARRLAFRLAWRNVWRNPRRTGLTLAATAFAVFLVVASIGLADGVHNRMIEDAVRLASGHVAISGRGYRAERTLEQFLTLRPQLIAELDREQSVRAWAPRVSTFALLSWEDSSRGVALLGVDPLREPKLTSLAERVRDGRFLEPGAVREIVVGRELARRLGAQLGDELLVFTQAYSLESAYELFTLVGSLALPEPGLERGLALISLSDAQELLVYGDRVSEIGLLADSGEDAIALRDLLRAKLEAEELTGAPVEVFDWSELMPALQQMLELDDLGMYLMLLILIVVVGFGILNTILMSVLERKRELGVMMALGSRPALAVRIVFVESLMLAAVGLAIGLVAAVPLVLYMQFNPIVITGELAGAYELVGTDPVLVARLTLSNPLGSSLTILAVAALAAWYPAFKAGRGRPVDALASL